MKAIRWGGLAGFAVFALILLVIGFFFIDNWIRAGLEAGGTRVNGAEVNVGDVDLTLNPLGFEISGVQVTNAADPARNLVELDDARVAMNLPQLFLGKVRIDDLVVDGLRTGTERETPGRVLPREEAEAAGPGAAERLAAAAGERVSAVRQQLPPADEAARDALTRTREAAADAETELGQALDQVQGAVERLPDTAAIDDYNQRIDRLRGREVRSLDQLRSLQADVEALQAEIMADQSAIVTARDAANQAVRTGRQALAEVTSAPAQDWAALRDAYPFNQATAVKAGRLLLGDAIFDRAAQLQTYYRQAAPWLRRLAPERVEDGETGPLRIDGRFVRYPHPDPSPDFLLDSGLIGFEANGWPWSLTVQDVTGQQRITNRPVTLRVARGGEGSESLLIDGTLDRRGETDLDRFEVTGRDLGWAPRTVTFMDSELDWNPGRVDLTGDVVVEGGALDGRLTLSFDETELAAVSSGEVAQLLGRALADISDFDLAIVLSGQVNDPVIQVDSDLDQRLNNALSAVLREEYDRWLATARSRLDAAAAELRAPLDAELNRIESRRDVVEQRAEAFRSDVIAELEALKNELTNQRQRLTQQLDEERRRAEESARDAARDALDDLEIPGF